MNKSLHHTQVMFNFDSAYNVPPHHKHPSTMYIPMSSSTAFSTFSNRSSSPLFHRSISPPSRPRISTGRVPKFNFDLYKMDEYEYNSEYDGYSSPTYRSLSPSSSRSIHHYPIHSPLSTSISKPQRVSKLREINDELCRTLARSELIDQSSSPPHYHIHHYPLSQHSQPKYRSRSTSEDRSPSTELEVSPKIHKARVTYKIHMPRRPRQEQQHRTSSRHLPTSNIYSSDEPVTVDLYPTRDQGFVKQIRKHPDNQSPWLVDGTSLRRNSYSDANTSRAPQSPKGPYYGDKPIKSYRRSIRSKEDPSSSSRHRSPYVTSRIRPDTAPLYTSDQFHESNDSFTNATPAWRSSGFTRRSKVIGSHDSESPSTKTRERVWHPPSKTISERPPKYFKPTLRAEYDASTDRQVLDGAESDPVLQRNTLSNRKTIRTGDPKLKKRIANAESKVKSTWEPTVTGLTQSTVKESKSPIPLPVRKTTTSTPPKSKVKSVPSEPTTPTKKVFTALPTTTNTGRSSLNDIPTKPIYESTPRNQSDAHEDENSVNDLFENESNTSEPSKKQELPRPPPRIEKTPTPQQSRKPSAELPKRTVPESDKGTKSTIKNGVLIRGNDVRNDNRTPSPKSEANNNNNRDDEEASNAHNGQPTPSRPKLNNKDDQSVVDNDDDGDENDQEVARSFDINKWLNDASKAILGPSKKGNLVLPSSPPQSPPKFNAKSPPRRKEQPPSPSPDENLYKPSFGPKKTDQNPSKSPPPASPTGEIDGADDFFS